MSAGSGIGTVSQLITASKQYESLYRDYIKELTKHCAAFDSPTPQIVVFGELVEEHSHSVSQCILFPVTVTNSLLICDDLH